MNERNTALQSIKDTISLYIDGVYNGDVERLKKAFYPNAMIYGAGLNNVTVAEIQGLYDSFLPIHLLLNPVNHTNVL